MKFTTLTSRLLLLCVFIKTDDSTTTLMLADQSVYENTTAVFTICNTANGYFTINDVPLPNSSFKDDAIVTSEDSCFSLMFEAVLDYDNYKIGFREFQSTQDIDTAILHVQGVLQAPQNFDWQDMNSTHMTIVWDAPFSWLGHENTSYKLIFMNENKEILSITVQELNHTILRPSTHISVYLTAINPVGEGESSLLDLKDSLAYCGANEVIDHGGYHTLQPYVEAGYINIYLLQEIKSDRNYCLGISDQVKIIHELVPTNTHYSLMFEDNTIATTLHDLPPSKHLMNVTIILTGVKTFNINFSTYQVQGVNMRDDNKTLQCHFLRGSTHNTCLVDVYNDTKKTKTLSGSNIYRLGITTPGTYHLKVYDDTAQRDLGIEPAKEIIFECCDKDGNESSNSHKDLIIGLTVTATILVLGLLCVAFVLAVYRMFTSKTATRSSTQPATSSSTSQTQPTIPCHPNNNAPEDSALIHGKGVESILKLNPIIACTQRYDHLIKTVGSSLLRTSPHTTDTTVIDIEHGIPEFNQTEAENDVEDKNKETEVLDGLPHPDLHTAPTENTVL